MVVQVLPLRRPQQWQGWIRKQDMMFTAVVDFCRLDGTPVGAFRAQLQWQKDFVNDEDEPHLTWQLCDAGVGKLSLLGVSSTCTGEERNLGTCWCGSAGSPPQASMHSTGPHRSRWGGSQHGLV